MGGEFVVISRLLAVEITEEHLENVSIYGPSSEKKFKSRYRKLNTELREVTKVGGLKSQVISNLKLIYQHVPSNTYQNS